MPAPVKATENMNKHLTDAEQQARQAAEDALLPKRDKITLKPPAYINKDKDARRYWTLTLKRLEGVALTRLAKTKKSASTSPESILKKWGSRVTVLTATPLNFQAANSRE